MHGSKCRPPYLLSYCPLSLKFRSVQPKRSTMELVIRRPSRGFLPPRPKTKTVTTSHACFLHAFHGSTKQSFGHVHREVSFGIMSKENLQKPSPLHIQNVDPFFQRVARGPGHGLQRLKAEGFGQRNSVTIGPSTLGSMWILPIVYIRLLNFPGLGGHIASRFHGLRGVSFLSIVRASVITDFSMMLLYTDCLQCNAITAMDAIVPLTLIPLLR